MPITHKQLNRLVEMLITRHESSKYEQNGNGYLLCIKDFEAEHNAKVIGVHTLTGQQAAVAASSGWSTRDIEFNTGEDELAFALKFGF